MKKKNRRKGSVLVTGCGVMCSAAADLDSLVAKIQRPDLHQERSLRLPYKASSSRLPPAWELALSAAKMAWSDASGTNLLSEGMTVGVIVGSSRSSGWTGRGKDPNCASRHPTQELVSSSGGALAGIIARELHCTGPKLVMSSACTSAASALALAADLILSGACDAAVAGGVDLGTDPKTEEAFWTNGLCAPTAQSGIPGCLPFDSSSNGIQLSDGAAFLVLEATGLRRQATPAPVISMSGWSHLSDPFDRCGISAPRSLLPRCICAALDQAGISVNELLFIYGHGNGNPRSDSAELAGLSQVARAATRRIPVVATKHITGHCLGATPAIEASIAVRCLQQGFIPPNVHLKTPWKSEGLDFGFESRADCSRHHICVEAFGLWGGCVSMVFNRSLDSTVLEL